MPNGVCGTLYGGEEGFSAVSSPFPRWRLRVAEFSSSHLRLPCLFPNLALPRVDMLTSKAVSASGRPRSALERLECQQTCFMAPKTVQKSSNMAARKGPRLYKITKWDAEMKMSCKSTGTQSRLMMDKTHLRGLWVAPWAPLVSLSFHLSSAFPPRFTFQRLLTRWQDSACWLLDRIHESVGMVPVRLALCDLEAPAGGLTTGRAGFCFCFGFGFGFLCFCLFCLFLCFGVCFLSCKVTAKWVSIHFSSLLYHIVLWPMLPLH